MANLLLIAILCSGFDLKWFLPKGTNEVGGRMCIGDTDRDGNYELYFNTFEYGYFKIIYIYELHLPNTWEADSFVPDFIDALVWDIGDFDLDGLYDLITLCSWSGSPPVIGMTVFESPDSFSYPTQEVWRDTVGPSIVTPIAVYDVDQDGIPEIIKCRGDPTPYGTEDFVVYEAVGNNVYVKLYAPVSDHFAPLSTLGFGDYDLDGKTEFVFGGEYYNIYESPADNTYEQIWEDLIYPTNIRDCFSVADADGDGRMEFVIKGFHPILGFIRAFIFEAIGNNIYTKIDSFTFYNGQWNYAGGHSEAGDVDGDSVPEIVLEACQDIYIIKSAGNDSFYVWDVLPGNLTGSNVRIFDLDNNGLNEIIISGNNQTRIYEYVPGNIEETAQHLAPNTLRLQVYPNPASNNDVRIRYTIPNKSKVGLIIYNSLGQAVDVLVDRELEAGVYELYWNRKLSAGVYFVKFTTNTVVTTNKLILLK
jgi:hypothetical protein